MNNECCHIVSRLYKLLKRKPRASVHTLHRIRTRICMKYLTQFRWIYMGVINKYKCVCECVRILCTKFELFFHPQQTIKRVRSQDMVKGSEQSLQVNEWIAWNLTKNSSHIKMTLKWYSRYTSSSYCPIQIAVPLSNIYDVFGTLLT